jgi:hypothetical protein
MKYSFTADDVKALRNATGASMMECKNILMRRELSRKVSELSYVSVELKEILVEILKLSTRTP